MIAHSVRLTRLDAAGHPVDPLSFDPLSFDPLSFDPLSFDPLSFDPPGLEADAPPSRLFPIEVTATAVDLSAEVLAILCGYDELETQLWLWGCRRWLHPGETEEP